MKRLTAIAVGLMALVVIGLALWRGDDSVAQGVRRGQPAPEIGGGPWINTEPLRMGALRGRVLYLEFWTYG